jgi:hypothetical protein
MPVSRALFLYGVFIPTQKVLGDRQSSDKPDAKRRHARYRLRFV